MLPPSGHGYNSLTKYRDQKSNPFRLLFSW